MSAYEQRRPGEDGRETATSAREQRTGRPLAIITAGLSAVAGVWSLVMIATVVALCRTTYLLPPSPGSEESTVHHGWNTGALWTTALPAVALLLALLGAVIGILLLVRRKGGKAWVLLVPCAALVLATLGPIIALAQPAPVY
ncbi:hypothetical protein [Brachybacterium kimchii]|uniref:Integral membrane protein n=1 Tax=Brachybacterium kimchii TaxID=2942909 RepID=A0ABY4N683_9MICO|nr:hypothetical protein [Brachybacterium kimchii]UQN28910.1 hypothetical protein M4486_14940 [Brachybacterium kimchii]